MCARRNIPVHMARDSGNWLSFGIFIAFLNYTYVS
jgi:hypothetical protein